MSDNNSFLYPMLNTKSQNDFNCAVCHQLPANLVESICCNSVFCWECVASLPNGAKCPNCPEAISAGDCKANIPLKRIVDGMKSSCKFGCGEQLTPDDRKHHELHYCPCRLVECPNSVQCGFFMMKDLELHTHRQCQFRKLPCPNECGNWLTIFDMEDHRLKYCPNANVPCPNGCQDIALKRVEVEPHLAICPLQEIPCEFAKHGCNQTVLRNEYEDHLTTGMAKHLSYVSESVKRQEEEMNTLRQQLGDREKQPEVNVMPQLEAALAVTVSFLAVASRFISEHSQGLRQRWDQLSSTTLCCIIGLLWVIYLVPGAKVIFFTVATIWGIKKWNRICEQRGHPKCIRKTVVAIICIWLFFHIF